MNALVFFLLPILLLLFSTFSPARPYKIPRLSPLPRIPFRQLDAISASSVSQNDFEIFYYNQTLDHFNYAPESYATFAQKYVICSKYWGGANASSPILAYLGAESPLYTDYFFTSFLNDNAPRFKALLVYMEHRFYGESVPFGSMKEAMKNDTTRSYFNSAQAIADYAELLLYIKETYSSPNSPIIVVGGSYGGMLAAWFRLKYPHIVLGALASSAPILYFDNITPQDGYVSVVTKDFKEASESCFEAIRQSWSEIHKVASQPNGLSILSKKFKTCSPLNDTSELINALKSAYSSAAQYGSPPNYTVNAICVSIDGAPEGTDLLDRIFTAVVGDNLRGAMASCYSVSEADPSSHKLDGWTWQTCSELVIPLGNNKNNTIFPPNPFILDQFARDCKSLFGVLPRPHWVTTYYGGQDIKLILKRFGSNIIFSNGLKDPYSSGGVLENLSDSLLAISTINGSHCLDIAGAKPDDPDWLIMQRNTEADIIEEWIKKYYLDILISKVG